MGIVKFMMIRIILLIFVPFISMASDISDDMSNFWNNMGGSSNITGSSSYKGQAAGFYSLGNIHMRTGSNNLYPVSLTMPSFRAGCGGIDAFSGSFSHINSDQLVATMKSIANNSVGFAFQLALESVSPMIASQVKSLNDLMQKVNSFNINSCETSALLAGMVWPKNDSASKLICSTMSNRMGMASDYAAARHSCSTGGRRTSTNKNESEEFANVKIENINIAWKALKDSKFFGEGSDFDKELAELFMTLSGTFIVKLPQNDNQGVKMEYISAQISDNDLISTLLDGGEVKTHLCDESDLCLNLRKGAGRQIIGVDHSYKSKINKMILSMIKKVTSNQELSNDEKALLNITSIPLYKMLNVYAAYSGSELLVDLPAYSELVALDILYQYLQDILSKVQKAADNLSISGNEQFKVFQDNIFQAKLLLMEKKRESEVKASNVVTLIERTSMIESYLAAELNSLTNSK